MPVFFFFFGLSIGIELAISGHIQNVELSWKAAVALLFTKLWFGEIVSIRHFSEQKILTLRYLYQMIKNLNYYTGKCGHNNPYIPRVPAVTSLK